jgi:hypothetical protein
MLKVCQSLQEVKKMNKKVYYNLVVLFKMLNITQKVIWKTNHKFNFFKHI